LSSEPWAELILGDCLEVMSEIEDGSVDMVLADPPYGTTACKWDSVIPFEPMWAHLRRVCKKNAAIVMTASQPFTSALVMSNVNEFAHEWVWNKRFAANFVQAKRQPLKDHENVLVFGMGGKQPLYQPQMVVRDKPIKKGGNKPSKAIPLRQTEAAAEFGASAKEYNEKHPTTVTSLTFSSRDGRGLHPTQKPVALMEYLIKTYTNEGETVLDFTMGSGTTGVACMNTGRNFIGIEMDEGYMDIAEGRIAAAKKARTE
jgi:site-specific DNA-methyltransferase (adenine-specific)